MAERIDGEKEKTAMVKAKVKARKEEVKEPSLEMARARGKGKSVVIFFGKVARQLKHLIQSVCIRVMVVATIERIQQNTSLVKIDEGNLFSGQSGNARAIF